MSKSDMAPQQYDAIVVGAGIAGLYTLHRLREMGKKVIAFETGDGVGGTWYWNRYPGARVDSQAYIYQYFFSKELIDEWSWSELFPAQPETERYLNFVADKFDLKKDIQFNTRVDQAVYDEAKRGWQVITDQGDTLFAQHFICCVGMLSAAAALQAPFPGKENFKGMVCHTARWPKEPVDFAGKRVGVVGTGATGIQVIQTVAPQCENLKVFQLVPEYTIPMRNPALVEEDNEAYRKQAMETRSKVRETFAGFSFDFDNGSFYDYSPEQRNKILEQLWAEGSLFFWIGSFFEVFTDEKANEEISEFVRNKIRARIDDPAVAEKLVPTNYGFGTRRVPLDAGYFEAYNRDNVELVDVSGNAIECITENGLKLANGEEHELDILILATGFDGGSGGFTAIDIHGRKGETLKEYWAKDMSTTFGLQVHGFPNLFTAGAPLAPSAAFCNMATCLVQQSDWITDAIKYLDEHKLESIEPTAEKEAEWVKHHDEMANATLVPRTKSWYTGYNRKGKSHRLISYIGGDVAYQQACNEAKESGYKGFDMA